MTPNENAALNRVFRKKRSTKNKQNRLFSAKSNSCVEVTFARAALFQHSCLCARNYPVLCRSTPVWTFQQNCKL